MGMADAPRVHVETVEQWRAWLAEHHGDEPPGAWAVTWKPVSERPVVEYEALVETALCFGWVDATVRSLDEERRMTWMTRRKPGGGWARSNKLRVERLEADGLMEPAGRAAVEQSKADGTWSLLDAVEDLVAPEDLEAAFDRHTGSRETWQAFPRSTRRAQLVWVVQAKRPATRAARVEEIAARAAEGIRANEQRRD
ncbi:YdeI family protein [Cellulomonas sp. HZM]|uniref:YdeI/OmpD-associated family protein n=1 Tax=Cellulomonas sp. HZM TaxID=1454010 RepID=UPI0004932595|nr:YdeI/OmpD-associated family protein [Cellulomonas sp. HZM]